MKPLPMNKIDPLRLAHNLRTMRSRLGLTQVELAAIAKVNPMTIYRIERSLGTRRQTIEKIALAMDVDSYDLCCAETPLKLLTSSPFIVQKSSDKLWLAIGDERSHVPEDNQQLIQHFSERSRQGHLHKVTLFHSSFTLTKGPSIEYIELYKAYEGGIQNGVYHDCILTCLRGEVIFSIGQDEILLQENDSVGYINVSTIKLKPAFPIGPNDLPPYLIWIGANK